MIPSTPLNTTITLLLVLVGISLSTTFDVLFSLGKVAGVLLGVLVYFAVVRVVCTTDRLRWAVAGFVVSGAALAIVGLVGIERASPKISVLSSMVDRLPILIRGLPGAENGFSPNPVAGTLVLFLPLQVALLGHAALKEWLVGGLELRFRRAALAAQVLAVGLTAAAVLLMQSRGAWLGLLAATVGWGLWRLPWTRWVLKTSTAVGALAVLVAGPTTLWEAVQRAAGPGPVADVNLRLSLWTSGLRGIYDAPWTGYGMNTFRRIMMERYPIPEITAHYVEVAHVHNNLLQAALDLGLPGLVAYFSMWLAAANMLWAVVRRAPSPAERTLAAAVGAGLVAYFVFGVTDAIPLGAKVGIMFWLTLALATALYDLALEPAATTPDA